MIFYSNKKVLGRSSFATYKLWLINGAVFAGIMCTLFVDSFSGMSFFPLVLKEIVHTLWIVPLYVAVNFVFSKDAFKNALDLRRNRG